MTPKITMLSQAANRRAQGERISTVGVVIVSRGTATGSPLSCDP